MIFNDENIHKIFGHEAAENESPSRLKEYYFKGSVFERVSNNMPLRILVGHKGLGKSALFQMSKQLDDEKNILSIILRPDDIHEVSDVGISDVNMAIRNWKNGLLRVIFNKTMNILSLVNENNDNWLTTGIKLLDKIITVAKPALEKKITIDATRFQIAKELTNNKIIKVYIDDLDRGWTASTDGIRKLSALLSASRDLVTEHIGLQIRISLRSDVYYLVRTSDESTDKIENSVVWYKWTNHEKLAMLVKRVQTYFGNEFSEIKLVNMNQKNLASLLDQIMEPRFKGKGKWQDIPTHQMLMTLIRRRPRDLIKLCTLAARATYERKGEMIVSGDFSKIFDEYSQGRLQDTINEYKSELPSIDKLLLNMKPSSSRKNHDSRYVFTNDSIITKIKNIKSNTSSFVFYPNKNASDRELLAFMYKINFLTGRKSENGIIIRKYFEESRYISSTFADFGFDWEIHPAYRWALQPDNMQQIYNTIDSEDE